MLKYSVKVKRYKNIFPFETYIISLLALFLWWGGSMVTPFMPLLAKDINLTSSQISCLLGAMGVTRLLVQPFLGIKIQSFPNQRSLVIIIFLLLLVSSLGYLFSNNFYVLFICRAMEALAFAAFAIVVRMMINDYDNIDKITLINSYYTGAQNVGRFIGPALAGIIVAKIGIKSIFLATTIIYILAIYVATKIDKKNNKSTKQQITTPSSAKLNLFSSNFFYILIFHAMEFFGLGLWLSGWAVYARIVLLWNTTEIGLSFSLMAIASITIVPFINMFIKNKYKQNLIFGLLLLAFQPFTVIFFKEIGVIVWLSFVIGGIGSTLYFTSFHTYNSQLIVKNQIAFFYGILGSATFLGQAVGQFITPFLWISFSCSAPILLDFITLILTASFYFLYFIVMSVEKYPGVSDEN